MNDPAPRPPRRFAGAVAYVALLALAAGAFALVVAWGETFPVAPGVTATVTRHAGGPNVLLQLLLALAAVILAGRACAAVCRLIGQPPVLGEVVAGIALGPSLLGRISPAACSFILPRDVAPVLSAVAQLGVILYMFLVGLELDVVRLRRQARASVAISHASIAFPFVLGGALALPLYAGWAGPGVAFHVFALFMGISLSVTAFPVLARILTDRGLAREDLGQLALTCAAADDATAWCLLAVVVGIAHADLDLALGMAAWSAAYVAFMLLVIRPAARRWSGTFTDAAHVDKTTLAIALLFVLLSAAATEAIGLHAIFGAFLLGALVPHGSAISRAFATKLEDLVTVLFLPAFFAYTGMRTQIGLLDTASDWLWCGAIIAVATIGKFGGTLAAARAVGLDWRTGSALGVLMNTRGLMELIVLNVGLDLGVISPRLFAMMVIMALVTTLATTPILDAIRRGARGAAIGALAVAVALVCGPAVAADDPAGSGSSGSGSGSGSTGDGSTATADEATAALARWAATLAGLPTLRVEFRQTKTLPVLKKPRVSDGVALVRAGVVRLSMSRDGALELDLVADAERLRLYYPALKRVEVMPRGGAPAGSGGPLPLASGDVLALARDHVVTVLGRDGAALRIGLVPRETTRASYRALELVLAEDRLVQLVQRGTRGEVAVLDILRWDVGTDLDPKTLELVVPPGTEVIDVGAAR